MQAADIRHIEILGVSTGGRVITVIEVLSPRNKLRGEGRKLYEKKQAELLRGGVNLVEIDLVPAGERVSMLTTDATPAHHRTLYPR